MKDASRITIQRIFIYFALLSCFTFDSIARLELNGKSMSKVYMQMEDGISNSGNGGISKYLKDTSTDFMNDFIHGFTYLPGTFKHMLTIPFQKINQIATGASLGFLGMSFFYDEQMDEFLRDHWEPQRRYFPMGEFPIPHLTLYKILSNV